NSIRPSADKGHRAPVQQLHLLSHSNGHRYIISVAEWMEAPEQSDRLMKVWNAKGVCTRTFRLKGGVRGAAVLGDLVACADSETVYVWDIACGKCIRTIACPRIFQL